MVHNIHGQALLVIFEHNPVAASATAIPAVMRRPHLAAVTVITLQSHRLHAAAHAMAQHVSVTEIACGSCALVRLDALWSLRTKMICPEVFWLRE